MPAEYVNKLARMFQDIKVSEDLNQEFKEKNRGSQVAGEDGRKGGRWRVMGEGSVSTGFSLPQRW